MASKVKMWELKEVKREWRQHNLHPLSLVSYWRRT